jgi:hypothetical protein
MMNILNGFYLPIIGFVITVAFGFWVSKLGNPYNELLFNIHKLIALGTVIIASIKIFNAINGRSIQVLVIASLIFAGLSVVTLFVSGALLSSGNAKYKNLKLIHDIAPFVAALSLGGAFYLLAG